jgi:hypothetical protein
MQRTEMWGRWKAFPVINEAEMIEAQQVGQGAHVDLVVLVAFFHGGILSRRLGGCGLSAIGLSLLKCGDLQAPLSSSKYLLKRKPEVLGRGWNYAKVKYDRIAPIR